jgi:hypothetical protein
MALFRKTAPTLVLKKFKVNQGATEEEAAVDVVGRPAGIFGFILSTTGIDSTTYLRVFHDRIEFREASFFGEQTSVFPLDAITAVRGGHAKPLGLLINGAILVVLGFPLLVFLIGFLMIPIGIVMIVFYFLGKSLNLEIANGGDVFSGLAFRRSVIENVTVDIDRVKEARDLIYQYVAKSRVGHDPLSFRGG